MAVVFISPKQRQKTFFMIITAIFILFLVTISLGVFMSKPNEVLPVLIFNKAKVNIDMKIFDSDQFKSLQPFTEMQVQYTYKAIARNKQPRSGFISATSEDEAKTTLAGMGLNVSEIKEIEIGRDNPFTPYYASVTVSTSVTKTAATQNKVSTTIK